MVSHIIENFYQKIELGTSNSFTMNETLDGALNETLGHGALVDDLKFNFGMNFGMLVTTIAIVGLVGNILAFIVLSKLEMKSSTNLILRGNFFR